MVNYKSYLYKNAMKLLANAASEWQARRLKRKKILVCGLSTREACYAVLSNQEIGLPRADPSLSSKILYLHKCSK